MLTIETYSLRKKSLRYNQIDIADSWNQCSYRGMTLRRERERERGFREQQDSCRPFKPESLILVAHLKINYPHANSILNKLQGLRKLSK